MPVIPRTEKSSINLSVVLEDLGELCYGNTIPGFHEISAPLWSRGQDAFFRNLGAARSSHLACNCLKALETFTLVTHIEHAAKTTELANGCMDVDVKGSIMSSGGASSIYL